MYGAREKVWFVIIPIPNSHEKCNKDNLFCIAMNPTAKPRFIRVHGRGGISQRERRSVVLSKSRLAPQAAGSRAWALPAAAWSSWRASGLGFWIVTGEPHGRKNDADAVAGDETAAELDPDSHGGLRMRHRHLLLHDARHVRWDADACERAPPLPPPVTFFDRRPPPCVPAAGLPSLLCFTAVLACACRRRPPPCVPTAAAARCRCSPPGRSLDDVDIDKYRSAPVPTSTDTGAPAVKTTLGVAIGPVSAGPSIAPGGNPMLNKEGT